LVLNEIAINADVRIKGTTSLPVVPIGHAPASPNSQTHLRLQVSTSSPLAPIAVSLGVQVVSAAIRLMDFWYDHYNRSMPRVSSGLSPILSVDRRAPKPLHKQIYDSFRVMIASRNLRAGQQIPSTRELAVDLKISRIPVLTAYSQLLAEGYFETRVGAGTFVCSRLPDQVFPGHTAHAGSSPVRSGPRSVSHRARLLPRHTIDPWIRGTGAFAISQPAYDQFPFRIWSRMLARHARVTRPAALHYGGPLGFEALREAICVYLRTSRAVRCDPQQVMIVSGSQQALEISSRVLLDSGDAAWMEEPGYWLTRHVLMGSNCRLIPVPVDSEGLDVAAGIRQSRKARVAFVTPSHQYPLGVTMSASRRLQLIDWAQNAGSWIIEDDYDSEYRFENMPIAALQGLDAHSRVIYIGTFSKTLFPSLRLGYIVIPPDLVERFTAVRHAIDLSPAHLTQAVLNDFMREGHYARHIRRMRALYHQRRTALVESIAKEFGSELQVIGAQAGMHLVVLLPKGLRDVPIAIAAAAKKLWLWPLSPSYVGQKIRQGLILGFGNVAVSEIPQAVRLLKTVISGTSRQSAAQ
jgi:GntR family transcriptional regulator / MocR family aminotransferase